MPNTADYGFKKDLPVAAIMELVAMVRSGEWLKDSGCTLQHVGWILGCFGKRFDRHTDDPLFATAATVGAELPVEPETIADCCAALESACSAEPVAAGMVGANPWLEALAVKLIKLILDQLLP